MQGAKSRAFQTLLTEARYSLVARALFFHQRKLAANCFIFSSKQPFVLTESILLTDKHCRKNMAFPIKVVCFISGLQTHLGLLCSEPSKSGGPVQPAALAEAGVDPAWAGGPQATCPDSQQGLGPRGWRDRGARPLPLGGSALHCPVPVLRPALLGRRWWWGTPGS